MTDWEIILIGFAVGAITATICDLIMSFRRK